MKGKIAIIGDGDSVLAFKAGGMEAFRVENADMARSTLKRIAKEYQIIYITDALAKDIDETIKHYISEPYPIIISIPSQDGSNGYGMECIRHEMERSLGVDILFKN